MPSTLAITSLCFEQRQEFLVLAELLGWEKNEKDYKLSSFNDAACWDYEWEDRKKVYNFYSRYQTFNYNSPMFTTTTPRVMFIQDWQDPLQFMKKLTNDNLDSSKSEILVCSLFFEGIHKSTIDSLSIKLTITT